VPLRRRSLASGGPPAPDAIRPLPPEAAAVFGLDAFSDGPDVLLPQAATGFAEKLKDRCFRPIGMTPGELPKAGAGAECRTLVLRGRVRDGDRPPPARCLAARGSAVAVVPDRTGDSRPGVRERGVSGRTGARSPGGNRGPRRPSGGG
jgi:hypothetical protein